LPGYLEILISSCDRKSHNVTRKVTPKERVVTRVRPVFSKRVGPNSIQQKSNPKDQE
jgi:hypothetical protein